MSEGALWESMRKNIGHRGHFSRLDYNPTEGIPDVDYCIKGIEGKVELKHRGKAPKRNLSPVFKNKGLRPSQVGWISNRVRYGGRVYILAQVDREYFLLSGAHWRVFNLLNMEELREMACWRATQPMRQDDWNALVDALKAAL